MRKAALAFAVAGGALLWATVAPAWADGPAAITFTTPASDGAVISTGPVTVAGGVSVPSGAIDGLDIIVRWTDKAANRPPGQHPTQETSISPPTPGPSYNWSFPLSPTANGQYTVLVTATTDDGSGNQSQSTRSQSFVQDIAPTAPTGLTEATDATKRVVTLSWQANTEPDLVGYQIFRAGPGANASFKSLTGVAAPQTSYTDNQVATQPPGTYRYQLVAVRPSGDGTRADVSSPSATVQGTFTTPAKAQAPSSPATTAAPGSPAAGSVAPAAQAGGSSSRSPAVHLAPVAGGLPNYEALLNQAQATTATTEPPDTGYKQSLPYSPLTSKQPIALSGGVDGAGALGAGEGSNTGHQTAEFVAAALMLGVLALFAFVLRGSADQAELLETLAAGTADAPPAPADVRADTWVSPRPPIPPGIGALDRLDSIEALDPLLITITSPVSAEPLVVAGASS